MAIKDESDIVKDILARVQQLIGPLFFTYRDAINLEIAIKSDWGGDKPSINTARGARIELRDRNVIECWDSGMPTKEIEKKFHISHRMVYRILKKYGRY
jgi:Mor family transcriptional regulator